MQKNLCSSKTLTIRVSFLVLHNNLCASKTLTIRVHFLALPNNLGSSETLTIRVSFLALPNNLCSSETLTIRVGFLCFTLQCTIHPRSKMLVKIVNNKYNLKWGFPYVLSPFYYYMATHRHLQLAGASEKDPSLLLPARAFSAFGLWILEHLLSPMAGSLGWVPIMCGV
jgi:hypothetical protein